MTVTDIRMSVTISRSSTKLGSGVISAMTIPSTAMGTASWLSSSSGSARTQAGSAPGGAIVLAGVIGLSRQFAVHEFVNVSQNLRHRAVEVRRNLLSHFHRLIQRARQRRIFDDRDLVLDGPLTDAQRQVILALGDYQRRGHALHQIRRA